MAAKYNCKDDDCHKYLVPEELLEEFHQRLNDMADLDWSSDEYDEACAEFNNKFYQYMVC